MNRRTTPAGALKDDPRLRACRRWVDCDDTIEAAVDPQTVLKAL